MICDNTTEIEIGAVAIGGSIGLFLLKKYGPAILKDIKTFFARIDEHLTNFYNDFAVMHADHVIAHSDAKKARKLMKKQITIMEQLLTLQSGAAAAAPAAVAAVPAPPPAQPAMVPIVPFIIGNMNINAQGAQNSTTRTRHASAPADFEF